MPQCKACLHSKRAEIDHALVAQESIRNVAARFALKPTSVHRHAARHLPEHLARASQAEAASQAADLLAELRNVIARERAGEETAEGVSRLALAPGGDRRVALRAVDCAGRCRDRQARAFALLAELRGLRPGVSVTLDNWPPPTDPPDMSKLSREQLNEVVANLRNVGRIVEGAGAESWTPPPATSWSRPNGDALP